MGASSSVAGVIAAFCGGSGGGNEALLAIVLPLWADASVGTATGVAVTRPSLAAPWRASSAGAVGTQPGLLEQTGGGANSAGQSSFWPAAAAVVGGAAALARGSSVGSRRPLSRNWRWRGAGSGFKLCATTDGSDGYGGSAVSEADAPPRSASSSGRRRVLKSFMRREGGDVDNREPQFLTVREVYRLLKKAPGTKKAIRLSAALRRAAREGRKMRDGRMLTPDSIDVATDKYLAFVDRQKAIAEWREDSGEQNNFEEEEEEEEFSNDIPVSRGRAEEYAEKPAIPRKEEFRDNLSAKVCDRIERINGSGRLVGRLDRRAIAGALESLNDEALALEVLDGLDEQEDLKDPNTFVVEAAKALRPRRSRKKEVEDNNDEINESEWEASEVWDSKDPSNYKEPQTENRSNFKAARGKKRDPASPPTFRDVPKEVQEMVINNQFNYVERIWSSGTAADLPVAPAFEEGRKLPPEEAWLRMPHVVVNGMTNSGKSTLINHVLKWSWATRACSVPGKTFEIDFFVVNNRFVLVDLPGYPDLDQVAHLGVAKKWAQQWEDLVWAYFDLCDSRQYDLRLMLHLQVTKNPPSPTCIKFVQEAQVMGFPSLLVLTKDDKIKDAEERDFFRRKIKKKLGYYGPHLHFTSDGSVPSGRKSRKQLHRWIRSLVNEENMEACVEVIQNAWNKKDKPDDVFGHHVEPTTRRSGGTAIEARKKDQTLAEAEAELDEHEVSNLQDKAEAAPSTPRWEKKDQALDIATVLRLMPDLTDEEAAFVVAEQAEAKKPVRVWTVNKTLPATEQTPTTWRYNPYNGLPMGIRPAPRATDDNSGEFLKLGEVFKVSEEKRGPKGMIFLKLADGRGWVFDRNPMGFLCKRQALDIEALEAAMQR
mmetsp:Transcript_110612/g.277073  ORF Transcript_110612/g.277073 Transcript_110612/m.277073 type:complete len:879 (+) Transcript_110612:36-2672(+)